MGSDFCSTPASSVDAECAFSSSHLQINHLQHNMNSQTFKAQMAVGSWAKSTLFQGFTVAKDIIEASMG
ncbi:hypothetical protein BDQ12DRAFT_613972 [Crucibulum laeve]|uniref:HAT C-terminal dimerisation domain-containing protein n=1 Tax=Crucibulum laeve TaxID=68775 RepID=A0A5C3LZJ0_9AGAR|nr:hypothetical protein BDQ12DRAFT_613972 [Crucibulum laeve]